MAKTKIPLKKANNLLPSRYCLRSKGKLYPAESKSLIYMGTFQLKEKKRQKKITQYLRISEPGKIASIKRNSIKALKSYKRTKEANFKFCNMCYDETSNENLVEQFLSKKSTNTDQSLVNHNITLNKSSTEYLHSAHESENNYFQEIQVFENNRLMIIEPITEREQENYEFLKTEKSVTTNNVNDNFVFGRPPIAKTNSCPLPENDEFRGFFMNDIHGNYM